MTHTTDIAIIGAGPVGLFAVFEAGMLKMRCHVIDALGSVGGQCTALYPEKPIYDIPAWPAIDAADLVAKLEEQAKPFSPTYHLGQRVEKLEFIPLPIPSPLAGEGQGGGALKANSQLSSPLKALPPRGGGLGGGASMEHPPISPPPPPNPLPQGEGEYRGEGGYWRLTTSKGTVIEAKAVVIAAGCGAFGPNRPPLAGIEAYEGTSVHYMVGRREVFRDKRIVIAGGGDSAVDWALSLSEIAAHTYVVHRRPKFRCAPESQTRLEKLVAEGKVEMVVPYQLDGIEGAGGQLTSVTVATLDGQKKQLQADALLPFFGLAMELGPIADWGLNLHLNHIKVDQATSATSQPGIFAIGDIAHYPHKLKLILCGFAEAAQAMHAAREIVYPGQAYHFEYSTSKGVPV